MLDTNVVLDLLHFDDAVARPLRQALEAGRVRCAASAATLDEWRRVLAYPEFGLDPVRQAVLLARYRALAEMVEAAGVPARLPNCSDPDDQKFIELAAAAGAAALVSKDRALLRLRRRCAPLFRVMTVAEAVRWLDAIAA
ncbi:MAG TPA: putative toxin-antitoxin system toxin component, PIN family [Steroidobacteraceae bacterium]|nr:putative toxin-antitoxin system toxin component, PIN family [Steroidobacteraceae bacterium]